VTTSSTTGSSAPQTPSSAFLVHLGHHRAGLLVPHEDGPDRRRIVERVEDASGVAARQAEDELDPGFFEHADQRVGSVDLGRYHSLTSRLAKLG
jgi:hypothetical protein